MTDPEKQANKTAGGSNSSGVDFSIGTRRFEAGWGSMTLEISDDCMEAVLLEIAIGQDERINVEAVIAALQRNNIVYGIDTESLIRLENSLNETGGWSGRQVVARGSLPGQSGAVSYTIFKGRRDEVSQNGNVWQVGDDSLSFSGLNDFFTGDIDPSVEMDIPVKGVAAGELIAVRKDPLQGKPGLDVFGGPVESPEFFELSPEENVQVSEDFYRFESSIYGYLMILDQRINVISPLRISADKMTAWFVNLPQISPSRYPGPPDIISQLEKGGVTIGIREEVIQQLCADLRNNKASCWTVVARGIEPVPGRDAWLDFSIDREKRAGKERDDGSMDMRDLNLFQSVRAGALIAVKNPPTRGTVGKTLFAEEIETTDGADLKVEGKNNVRVENDGGRMLFYAQAPGIVEFSESRIGVSPVYQISGDVDFSTGNLDVDCNLVIPGSIRSEFSVKTTGNASVGGIIEPGADVRVQGDLVVQGGIIGETTKVTVLGSLQTLFIQDARVVVKGHLTVENYIYNGAVRAVGEIEVKSGGGGRQSGSIVGGEVCSSDRISLAVSGSASNVPTFLSLQPNPRYEERLKRIREEIFFCDKNRTKMMRTLHLQTIDPESVRKLLARVSGDKKELYVKILLKLNELVKHKQKSRLEKVELQKRIGRELKNMSVKMNKTVHANTRISIGEKEMIQSDDLGEAVFVLGDGKIVCNLNP